MENRKLVVLVVVILGLFISGAFLFTQGFSRDHETVTLRGKSKTYTLPPGEYTIDIRNIEGYVYLTFPDLPNYHNIGVGGSVSYPIEVSE